MIKNKVAFKARLIESCRFLVESKLTDINLNMDQLQNSANEESKSSAGDKYETARAMAMLEKEKLAEQREVLLKQLETLSQCKPVTSSSVDFNTVVRTDQAVYYVAAGLGSVKVEGVDVFAVSAMAPLVLQMKGGKEGEGFKFNGKSYTILEVF